MVNHFYSKPREIYLRDRMNLCAEKSMTPSYSLIIELLHLKLAERIFVSPYTFENREAGEGRWV